MSGSFRLAVLFGLAIIVFGLIVAFCSVAGCTLRVDPQIDPPRIDIGCVVVELGQNTVEMCPDAGGQAVPSHNIEHALDASGQ